MPIVLTPITNPEADLPRTSLAKWKVITPPASSPIAPDDVIAHLRLPDGQNTTTLQAMIDAAVDYAQGRMEICLMPQDIQATFYDCEPLILPRGPLMQIYEVQDRNETIITDYDLKNIGNDTQIVPNVPFNYPASITFQAGYADAETVPASIKLALLAHVGTMYEARESTTDKPRTIVPHSLEDFYRLKRRGVGIA
jgi:uncharacterized phiE125 gp8 family phage protein